MKPLPPIEVPWKMKPLCSAQTRVEELDDGRLRFSIRHEVLAGVTPAMLVWWLNNMDGTVRVGDREIPRYRAWHPLDHVALTYLSPGTDGRKFSAGARVHIQEFFNREPRYQIEIIDEVDFLDESGFRHARRIGGLEVGAMDYTFIAVPAGTRYENSLTIGPAGRKLVNKTLGRLLFPEDKGRAWLKHNVEEVGNLQFFLPSLYASSAVAAGAK